MFCNFSALVARKLSKFRDNAAVRTDERVRLMNEIITGIKVIKMYTWEKPFAELVARSRKLEIIEIKGASFLRGILMSFAMFGTRLSSFISIFTFIIMGNNPNAYYVFVVTSFYNSLRIVMTTQIPQGMALFGELNISIKRIQDFLKYEELEFDKEEENKEIDKPNGIYIKNATARWDFSSAENTLKKINMEFLEEQLIAVIGAVGSGKSSLLQAILKELPLTEGNIEIKGSISYSAQEPWIFTGTVRQNIVFGEALDNERYNIVVKVCALENDFLLLPYGDRSIVGERGVLLSGGQKARISLARTVYRQADIYLLDDPLSAVDANVGKQLFDNCITGFLKKKCVVLVTHQLQYLGNVDNIMVLEDGRLVASGSYKELQDYLGKLMHEENEKVVVEEPSEYEQNIDIKSYNSGIKSLPKETEEQRSTGKVDNKVYMAYIKATGGLHFVFLAFVCFILAQIAANGCDYFITFW